VRLTVRVPATIANLGPGFDCLGMAVGLHNEVTLAEEDEFSLEVSGEGANELPRNRSNLIPTSMEHFARAAGRELPSFSLHCTNRIPLERGLGSSSSAVVAGVTLADRLLGTSLEPDRLLGVAVEVEGHADNVAPALRGGLVLAYRSRTGWRAEQVPLSPELMPVVLVPRAARMPTLEARRVLPGGVTREDAVFNAARAALLVMALGGRTQLLAEALEDRLHQDVRLSLVPEARRIFDMLREAGVPVCVAGSGPSLLAFEREGMRLPEPDSDWEVLRLRLDLSGAKITSELCQPRLGAMSESASILRRADQEGPST